ncbi:acyltransferase family protein [Pedobacter sp.]|uniref:acyltransferase family protein n=1 Tax=Pedobacter sp. TaxID=1411316 RepID=UPI003BAAC7BD
MKVQQRIEPLDWLRGLMALSIMFHHMNRWFLEPLDASTALGRIGVYGVSIFFILSGLSMAIVYNSFIKNSQTAADFFIRRIFRIWPLLWLVIIIVIIQQYTNGIYFSWKLLFLNFTTLFGFLVPTQGIASGSWSIGSEMVFYALTPFLIYCYNLRKWLGNLIFLISLLIGLYFAFYIINANSTLSDQWRIYVNPLNNLFLYVMGIGMYYNLKDFKIKNGINIIILVIACLVFAFLPIKDDLIKVIVGVNRLVFVILSFVVVLCFYKMEMKLPKMLSISLETLGIATYGVYLLHPIVYTGVSSLSLTNVYLNFVLVSTLTVALAVFLYNFFETRFIKLGKNLTNSLFKKSETK